MNKPIPYLELKASLLLVMLFALVVSAVTYLMYARGVFESTQQLILLTDDSEGVNVGMDLTFSGFAIGRVRRIDLGNDGKVRITVDLARKDAKWIRNNSVFTLERGLVGGTNLRAFSGDLGAPLLADGATRPVLRGDASSEIPRLMNDVHTVLDNLSKMTQADSALNASLGNVQSVTEKMKGRYGVLGSALGDEAHAKKLIGAIDGVNQLLARSDSLLKNADGQLFGPQGVSTEAQATVKQLNGMLADARGSLKKVDGVLAEAEKIAANARVASTDLGELRAQVELSLRKVEHLVNEVNRKWPLARDTELKLP
jgi:phospholipid/cholesterol/gamma-HCH transport system substrate-binding protein